jgi:fluoroquinolone transport system ATP-binding protein
LDEPTSGLDPVNARNIKDLVLELADRGTTVFVTTHNMMVADELCDRIGFIADGRIALIDSPESLKRQYGERTVEVAYGDGSGGEARRAFPIDGLGENEEFIGLLKGADRIETIHTQETTLEQIFIEVTGQELT